MEAIGKKPFPSESYLLKVRHMLKEYGREPSDWDEDYPEEMEGKMYPEDVNGLVQIDIALYDKDKLKNDKNHSNGIG